MGKLTTNIETYSVLGETLQHIRGVIREVLVRLYQDRWEMEGIPDEIRGHLTKRRIRERSIQWQLSERSDLLDFAGFANLDEIVSANPELSSVFASVAPDAIMRHTRFVEMDTILNRVSFMRPVTDTELEFAVTFQERMREISGSDIPEPEPSAGSPRPVRVPEGSSPVEEIPAETAAPADPSDAGSVRESPAAETARGKRPAAARIAMDGVHKALEDGDDMRVLEAIYHEITALAETLWANADAVHPRVWAAVRESPWYAQRFSPLGLKPISDFYALHDAAREALEHGASRSELQEMLQDRKFGEIVLALRELFNAKLAS